MAITESWLKANLKKQRDKPITKTDRDGLMMRVSPKGKITFSLRYYYNGKQTRIDLGSYPLLTLKNARSETQRLRAKLEQGHDPKVVRQLEKQAIIAAKSLKNLFGIWYDAYCVKNKKGHHEIKRSFEIHVFPRIGDLPAEKISLHAWLDILESLAVKRPAIAERILVNAKQLLKYGLKRKLIPSNVLADIYAKEDLHRPLHEVACFLEEHGEMAGDVLAHFGDDLEEAKKALEENYQGCYESLEDYAEELTTETSEVPEHLAFYIDYEKMARDMELSGDIFTVETGYREVHVFWSH